jgi:hypothetical protein
LLLFLVLSPHTTVLPQPVTSSKTLKAGSEQLRPLLTRNRSDSREDCLAEKVPVSRDSDSDSDDFPALHRSLSRNRGGSRLIHDIEALAIRFSDLIPERRCSMASLQEYLMGFRTDPEGACSEGKLREFLRETLPNITTVVDDMLGPKEGMDKYATDTDER